MVQLIFISSFVIPRYPKSETPRWHPIEQNARTRTATHRHKLHRDTQRAEGGAGCTRLGVLFFFLFLSSLESLERICLRTKTYIVLLPWRSWRRSLQLFPAFALAWPTLVRCRMVADVPVTTGPGPGLGVRDADGSPRRESRTSSRVVEPGLGLFRRRAAVAIASSVSLWPDPNRFHAGVKKETEMSAASSCPRMDPFYHTGKRSVRGSAEGVGLCQCRWEDRFSVSVTVSFNWSIDCYLSGFWVSLCARCLKVTVALSSCRLGHCLADN